MAESPEYLVEVGYVNASGLAGTIYLSCGGYITKPGDSAPNRYYEPRIADIGPLTQNIYGSGLTIGSGSDVGYGAIVVSNADGALDTWLDYAFDGRLLVVKRLSSTLEPYSAAETIFTGTIERIDADDAWESFRLRIYDRRLIIDRPLQTTLYAGTTTSTGPTAEGTAELKDHPKPLLYGRAFNIPAVFVNVFDLIYQVSNSAVSSIVVYDGGVPLTYSANYSSISALRSATISGGSYATCLSLGLFRLGSQASKDITADAYEGSSLSSRMAGSIARRMLTKVGVLNSYVDTSSANALDASAPYECGIWISDATTASAAISAILSSVGGWMVPYADGVFKFGRMDVPSASPVATIDYATDVILTDGDTGAINIIANPDTDGGLPAWRVILSYARVYRVQGGADVHGCVDDAFREFLIKDVRETKAESATTRSRYLLSPEMRFETLLIASVDASTEATRRLSMYSVRRDVIRITLPASNASLMLLGATINVKLPRFGYDSGRRMVVIGREYDLAKDRITMTLWG